MTFPVLGGILLILAAWYISKGEIYVATGIYAVADLVWIIVAVMSGDYLGAIFILIGAFLGLLAMYRMNKGTFHQKITKN